MTTNKTSADKIKVSENDHDSINVFIDKILSVHWWFYGSARWFVMWVGFSNEW